jgi:SsrA-binding protein
MTLVPIALYLKKGRAKIKIAIARGKQASDKRAAIKERDDKRAMQRATRRDED